MRLKFNPSKLSANLDAKKRERFIVKHGDNLKILRSLNPNQFDSIVTDPPAGIAFMGKSWDSDKGGRDQWIAWLSQVLKECYRVLKPGAHGVVWSLPKTSHWTAIAIEDAGFEIVDCVMHLFGSGFPKSQNISKMIDKELGAEREVIGSRKADDIRGGALINSENKNRQHTIDITASATPEAQKWEGWGTALKPSYEPWWLIRKPIEESSIARNVLKHGVGGLNIDAARVGLDASVNLEAKQKNFDAMGFGGNSETEGVPTYNAAGRFPANVVFSHSSECELIGVKNIGKGEKKISAGKKSGNGSWAAESGMQKAGQENTGIRDYGSETVENWKCADDCPVKKLDEQSGNRPSSFRKNGSEVFQDTKGAKFNSANSRGPILFNDLGSASRFFYVAKASKSDKGDENGHPTVKSTRLMEYLIKMVTPENGTVLDPFMGSGTTGVSAIRNDFKFFGIDQEKKYTELAIDRMMSEYKVTDKKLNAKRVKK